MKKIVVTGANGFIGTAVSRRLIDEGFAVTGTFRSNKSLNGMPGVLPFETGDIDGETDWGGTLKGADAVVHTAARAHIVDETTEDPLAAYRLVNLHGTVNLARQAAESGVKRFIFLSSVKVNGETSPVAYTELDKPSPKDAYGISKMEAEQALLNIASETGMTVITLRSPLVYGPKVKANFLRLLQIVDRGIPLPLAWVKNQRSLLFVENLADAIVRCIRHTDAAVQTYMVRDGIDVTTPELIRMIASAFGHRSRLFGVSPNFLHRIARALGKETEAERLMGSLTVEDTKIRQEVDWEPPFTIEYGLNKTIAWYKSMRNSNM